MKPQTIDTAEKVSTSCGIIGEGYLEIQNATGQWLTVKTLHVPNVGGIIVSPTFMAVDNENFTSWEQITHTNSKVAKLILYHRHEYRQDMKFNLHHHNNCWFVRQGYLDTLQRVNGQTSSQFFVGKQFPSVTVNSLNKAGEYEL